MADQNNSATLSSQDNIILISDESQIVPDNIPLTDLLLPDQWVLYLYDKLLFKKVANKKEIQSKKPFEALCTITTVNDLVYLLQLMKVKVPATHSANNNPRNKQPNNKSGPTNMTEKINLDMNDYIIMRKGIEPIWEDPRNKNGGTLSIQIDHARGYDIWSTFIIGMLGESLTENMNTINGISVSYISNMANINTSNLENKNSCTYIKIWDGKQGRNREGFLSILPEEIISKIKNDSIRYACNNQKNDYDEGNIYAKFNNKSSFGSENKRGGFRSQTGGRGGGGNNNNGGGGRGRGTRY